MTKIQGNIIAIFSGTAENIPKGWKLCNGENNTPNLKDKFIKGAVNDEEKSVGEEGGNKHHTHNVESGGSSHSHSTNSAGSHTHRHDPDVVGGLRWTNATDWTYITDSVLHSHTSGSGGSSHTHDLTDGETENNIPSFYELMYIMCERTKINFPENVIIAWSGSINDIPEGYVFCDGNNGTSDLRDKFIKCTNNNNEINQTHEYNGHTHNTSTNTHGHTGVGSSDMEHRHSGSSSGWEIRQADNHSSDCTTDEETADHDHSVNSAGGHSHQLENEDIDPPFYRLALIMKKLI